MELENFSILEGRLWKIDLSFKDEYDEEFDYIGEFCFFLFIVDDYYVSLDDVELVWDNMKVDDFNFFDLFLLEDFFEDGLWKLMKINFGC